MASEQSTHSIDRLTGVLRQAGFPSPEEDVVELAEAADELGRSDVLEQWVARRQSGEPIPWITGRVNFLGLVLRMEPGVYVPRPQTEIVARRAIELLPTDGLAVDVATGCGAVAAALAAARPTATVLATDIDPLACRCARSNGVDTYQGDLGEPLPAGISGRCDVMTAVVPYVPIEEFEFLPHDVRGFEPLAALDGGQGGTAVLRRLCKWAAELLRPGGTLVAEMGGNQPDLLLPTLQQLGLRPVGRLVDAEGDLRGMEIRRP